MGIEKYNFEVLAKQKTELVKENIKLKEKICDLEMEIEMLKNNQSSLTHKRIG